jgi:hypothetical protein
MENALPTCDFPLWHNTLLQKIVAATVSLKAGHTFALPNRQHDQW